MSFRIRQAGRSRVIRARRKDDAMTAEQHSECGPLVPCSSPADPIFPSNSQAALRLTVHPCGGLLCPAGFREKRHCRYIRTRNVVLRECLGVGPRALLVDAIARVGYFLYPMRALPPAGLRP